MADLQVQVRVDVRMAAGSRAGDVAIEVPRVLRGRVAVGRP
jgi:hypothetical protein